MRTPQEASKFIGIKRNSAQNDIIITQAKIDPPHARYVAHLVKDPNRRRGDRLTPPKI